MWRDLVGLGDACDFNQGGVEGCSCADVGEALAGEGVDVGAVGVELGPVKAGGDDAGGQAGVEQGCQLQRAAIVEDADGVAFGQVAGGGVRRVDFQALAGAGLHFAVAVEIGEGRVHVVVRLAGEEFEGIRAASAPQRDSVGGVKLGRPSRPAAARVSE